MYYKNSTPLVVLVASNGYLLAKLIAEYRAEVLTSAVVPYVDLKKVAHGMVCLSESHRRLNSRDVVCARRYSASFH